MPPSCGRGFASRENAWRINLSIPWLQRLASHFDCRKGYAKLVLAPGVVAAFCAYYVKIGWTRWLSFTSSASCPAAWAGLKQRLWDVQVIPLVG